MNATPTSETDTGHPADEGPLPEPTPPGQALRLAGPRVTLCMDTDESDPPLGGWIERLLARAVRLAGAEDAQLSLVVVDDAAMTRLHRDHLDIDSTTDVLTFDLRDGAEHPVDGEIIICLDEAARQAKARGHDARTEALLYAVHGLLHLMGEDDHDEQGYARMHRREDQLLEAMGIGAVFARDDALADDGGRG